MSEYANSRHGPQEPIHINSGSDLVAYPFQTPDHLDFYIQVDPHELSPEEIIAIISELGYDPNYFTFPDLNGNAPNTEDLPYKDKPHKCYPTTDGYGNKQLVVSTRSLDPCVFLP